MTLPTGAAGVGGGTATATGRTHAPHMPGITGLRGIAVAAVVAYHLEYLPGGFLGVDLFFVLSGFLITTLLLRSPPDGAAGLRRWWTRRFTRLTPAVVVVVLAVLIAFAASSGVVIDSIATLTWWQNWHLIFEGLPYWSGSPSPLRHAWSLSIEEQFYVVWPPVLMGLLAFSRRSRRRSPEVLVAAVAAALAAASFVWAGVLAMTSGVELSRIYFGTDTRAGALLLGCSAAALLRIRPMHRRAGPRSDAGGVLAAAVLVLLCVVASPEQRWVYTGGLLLSAACSLMLIMVATRPGPAERLLEWAPLQWMGVRSYAIYLWSWPLQVLLEETELPRSLITLLTVAGSLLLASISLRLVEDPLRRADGWARRLWPRRAAWLGGSALVVVAMVFAASSTQLTVAEQVAPQFEKLPDPVPVVESTTTTICVPPPPNEPAPAFTGDTTRFDRSTVERPVDPSGVLICADEITKVLVVGDSTGRGAVNGLRRLGASDLEVWDRTDLGCGLVSTDEDCPDWRTTWSQALDEIQPELVLAYMRTSDELVPGDEPEFTSPQGGELRRAQMAEATQLLGSRGARVVWVLPAAPLPLGAFYCGGIGTGTACDPNWVASWRADLAQVAAEAGAPVVDESGQVTAAPGVPTIDVQAWVDARAATAATDRPDGLHFSGPALDAHAAWLADQLRSVI